MANTYTQIGNTVTVGSGGTASITFSSIPSTFTDLCLKISARTNRSDGVGFDNISLQFNGSATGYSMRLIYATGTSALSVNSSSTASTFQYGTSNAATANTFGNSEVYIPNYAGSTNKSFSSDSVTENNSNASNATIVGLSASLWSNTEAINSIGLTLGAGLSFNQYTTASLYGINNS